MRSGTRYFFFFNDTATTEIYTLSLHDALPISLHHDGHPARAASRVRHQRVDQPHAGLRRADGGHPERSAVDRKSTRLNSSHANISYAVFCLKKKTFFSSPLSRLLLSTISSILK